MNDPHVVAVHYRLEFSDRVEFQPPAEPLVAELDDFTLTVTGADVHLAPRSHIPSRQVARALTDPLMQAWAVEIGLRSGLIGTRVEYVRTEVVDRNPTPGVVHVQLEGLVAALGTVTIVVTKRINDYPLAPTNRFILTPDVDSLWRRYQGFIDGREPLASIAYFVYTVLTPGHGGRRAAAVRLNVQEDVLRKLSELSSTRGDALTARKASAVVSPLSSAENAWLAAVIPRLILQLGLSGAGPSATPLTLNDLPDLNAPAS